MNGILPSINGKMVILGDTHFGVKKFSIDVLMDQLAFLNKEVYPYMEENNIKYIFQLGDLMDQRTTADINFIDTLKREFFEVLKEKGITLFSLVGNHDIYWRESREVTLVKFFRDLYPDNFILYENRESFMFNNNEVYVVPWIVKGEELTYNEIKDKHSILGHFEIRHFHLVKGHMDNTAKLTAEFFTENTEVRNVFSGHYHIKDTKGLVKYLGTPWQINWSDYEEDKGFYVWNEDDTLDFFENNTTKKFIKVKYNDNKNTDRNIEVSGLYSHSKLYTDKEYEELLPSIKKHEIKFFVNEAKDRHFDEVLYMMKEANIASTVIDNQKMSEIIGTNYIDDSEDLTDEDTRSLIINTVKDNKKELIPLINEILAEIDSTNIS